jgi:uncharacterized protein YbgA (DUF1722 family)/uncharacterized protein YbbK (DUF523 family)
MTTPIRIGISSCLLGNQVRYDGGHQLDPFITGTLGRFFEFVPVCPEADCGLGVPRETMRLEGDPATPRLMTTRTHIDHSERMLSWSRGKVAELEALGLLGFIFKAKSPSSGMERVKVYPATPGALPKRVGVGLFARVFMEHFPLLPVEDEGRLHDLALRENFIERIFALCRWRATKALPTVKGLIAFHSCHKLQIMAHSVQHYREMGRLVARTEAKTITLLFAEYEAMLMAALKLAPTVKKQVNVLHHLLGYFKKVLTPAEKEEMLTLIDHFRQGLLPVIVPITLLNHYVGKYGQEYLAQQTYLHPHPLELQLKNHG